jgi:ABC-type transport system substrate-binding protein
MDANDVAFTFKRLKDSDLNILTRKIFKKLLSAKVIDKYRVELTTDGPCPDLNDLLTRSELFPLSSLSLKKYADRYGQVILIGTGPFCLEEWSKNERIVLIRNTKYRDPPFLDRISFELSNSSSSRVQSLEASRSHVVAMQITHEEAVALGKNDSIRLFYSPGQGLSQIYLNSEVPPFDQESNRLALAYGIDRTGLVKGVFEGFATPADTCIPPWNWAHKEGYRPFGYEPEKARRQIKSNGEPLRFSLLVNKEPVFLRQAYYVKDCLAKIPILVDIVPVSKDELFDFVYGRRGQGQFQAALEDWNDLRYGRDPRQFTSELYASSSPYNKVRLFDPILDRIFEEIDRCGDFFSRQELYFAAESRIMNSVSTVYLCFPYHIHAARSEVMNLSVNPLNEIDFRDVWLAR